MKNEANSFICIFQVNQYLIDLTLSIENHVKHSTNQTKAQRKKIREKHCGKYTQKKKTEKRCIQFLVKYGLYIDLSFCSTSDQSSRMKVIKVSYISFL